MEAQPAKRRRVYSLEPNKIVMQSIFARNYLNYLVPALMKIKAKSSAEDNSSHFDIKNVKYEVDMAMVFSAQGFAWCNGLKIKLERDHGNVATSTISFLKNEASNEGSSIQNEVVTQDYFFSNPSSKSQSDILGSKSSNSEDKKDLAREDNEDEDKMKSLRMLIPGGEEMCDEQMVVELESYIRCLQMQVNVLQCLLAEP